MTILNVHLQADRAIVTTNTQAELHDEYRSLKNASKLFALPGANCLVAGRGDLGFCFDLYANCFGLMTDFDGMSEVFEALASNLAQRAKEAGYPLMPSEFVLVGPSRLRGQMAMVRAELRADGSVTACEADGLIAPWDTLWHQAQSHARANNLDGAVSIARVQATYAEEFYPGGCWHGDLIVAEVSVDSIAMHTIRDFSGKESEGLD